MLCQAYLDNHAVHTAKHSSNICSADCNCIFTSFMIIMKKWTISDVFYYRCFQILLIWIYFSPEPKILNDLWGFLFPTWSILSMVSFLCVSFAQTGANVEFAAAFSSLSSFVSLLIRLCSLIKPCKNISQYLCAKVCTIIFFALCFTSMEERSVAMCTKMLRHSSVRSLQGAFFWQCFISVERYEKHH